MNTQFVLTEPNGEPGAQRLRARGQPARLAHGAVPEQGDGRADGDGGDAASCSARRWPSRATRPADGLWPAQPLVAVKGPVFSMAKLVGAETALGPEMKSTGEVMGVDKTYPAGAAQGAARGGHDACPSATARPSSRIADRDKAEALPILRGAGRGGLRASTRPAAPREC